jgi:hypothetical protein
MRRRGSLGYLPLVGVAITALGLLADRFGLEVSTPLIWIGLMFVVASTFIKR